MKEQVFISAIVYVRDEENSVVDGLEQLNASLATTFKNYEIILINDASGDATLTNARKVIESILGNLTIINLSRPHGIEKAMNAGLVKSIGDFIFEIENINFDYSLEIIHSLFKTAISGNDIVAASPNTGLSWPSKLFYKLINNFSYLKLDLKTESIRIVSRRALNAMLNLKEKVRYRKALYAYTGFKKYLIAYDPIYKVKSDKSKLNRENISTAFDVIVSFSNIGLKISHYLSIAFLLFSLFMAGYALYNYFFNKNIVQGWTTLMILISFGFTGLFFIVGMLGEYISRILIEIQNRPFYTTSSIEMYKPVKYVNHEIQQVYKEAGVAKE
ncbi:glycosyltransferase involved in cell wall biosynthesis [Paenibacillus sp. V4I9]|uniref:glycosyltransferase n=1 Tax=Paenibacillus sp. V4I9 TaxID=3042308 RepID=UPI002782724D|nr:glycosyltransferase [Paenibacillus sp. V4I9]MDQ0890933.1 glycosyltransferase involved in cell wall biosynthesis [Paenibacillus sp. V4I9]